MTVHKEGTRIVLITLLACVLITWVVWVLANALWTVIVGILLLLLFLFVVRFFRIPQRLCVESDDVVYSPADGRIVAIEEVVEPEYFGERRLQVSVFMSVWNVHANWYPVGGRVVYTRYHKGKFLVAWLPKSSTENERSTVVVERPDGKAVLLRQIAGAVARRIVTYSKPEDAVRQGQELGFIKFGSRVDVFLPLGAEVLVHIGDAVVGTQTPLARM